MALYPCDIHGGRYTGPQQTMYPAMLTGTDTVRAKKRMCPVCFSVALDFAQSFLKDIAVPGDDPNGCVVCGSDDTGTSCFLTVYATKADRRDFFGGLCPGCREQAETVLFGSGTAPVSV
jgi:hypothetical protein